MYRCKVFYEDQFGSLVNKAITGAILKFNHECYFAPISKQHLISRFFDPSKPFDSICLVILIRKL